MAIRQAGAPPSRRLKVSQGTTYEHQYMRRSDNVYPITDTEMNFLNVTTAVAGFLGAAASWFFNKALTAREQIDALGGGDSTAAQLAQISDSFERNLMFGGVFGVLAIGGWLGRGSILRKIKRQCVPHTVR